MAKYVLYSIAFLTGFAVMAFEILGMRVVEALYGSQIAVIGAIISVFLAGLSIGYALGGRLADKRSDMHTLARILQVPAALIVIMPFYSSWLCRFFGGLNSSIHLDTRAGSLLISMVFFLVPCIFLGAVIPMTVKILTTDIGKVGSASGNVYAVSTAGSIAGTLFTSFYLISWAGVSKGIMIVGMLVASCWFLCLYCHLRNNKQDGISTN